MRSAGRFEGFLPPEGKESYGQPHRTTLIRQNFFLWGGAGEPSWAIAFFSPIPLNGKRKLKYRAGDQSCGANGCMRAGIRCVACCS